MRSIPRTWPSSRRNRSITSASRLALIGPALRTARGPGRASPAPGSHRDSLGPEHVHPDALQEDSEPDLEVVAASYPTPHGYAGFAPDAGGRRSDVPAGT